MSSARRIMPTVSALGVPSPVWAASSNDQRDSLLFYSTFQFMEDTHKLIVISASLTLKQSKAASVCQAALRAFQHPLTDIEIVLYTGLGSNLSFATYEIYSLRMLIYKNRDDNSIYLLRWL